MKLTKLIHAPTRDYYIIVTIVVALLLEYFFPFTRPLLAAVALLGGIPTAIEGLQGLLKLKITIEAFNFIALAISFGIGEYRSTAFIALMLAVASILEWHTESRTKNAVSELLALKPHTAIIEKNGEKIEVPADSLSEGDVMIVATGARVPADGIIVHGSIFVNEAPVTGESVPVYKEIGDEVFSGTLGDSGVAKVRVLRTSKESTLERMAVLIEEAAKNKSKTERIADTFAGVFLPLVLVFGGLVYYFTHNASITASIFLVACADDLAVAIPLAVSAAIGVAAKRGVIIKGGEWLQVLSSIRTVVLDKTGTLTYGNFSISSQWIEPKVEPRVFWEMVGAAERYSEHPVGRAIYKEALKHTTSIPDHESVEIIKGVGVRARVNGHDVCVGDHEILDVVSVKNASAARKASDEHHEKAETSSLVIIDGIFVGSFGIADTPRPEAKNSLLKLRHLGVERVAMFTGDNEQVAAAVAGPLGVTEVLASLSPEEKLHRLEQMPRPMAMVGDGINDAPALARADVGIAMGSGGTAVAVEAADVVILTDNLERLPEMVELGRRTVSVIRWDIIIWVVTNAIGFALALTGVINPALAAFYNFITDFFPMINSARLFRSQKAKP